MPTVAFHTLGCKVNQYDTQAMLELFEQAGYQVRAFDEPADVYVVNTCTVTGTGDKKSMQAVRRALRLNPAAQVVIAGCMAQRDGAKLLEETGARWQAGSGYAPWKRICSEPPLNHCASAVLPSIPAPP